MKQYIGARYVPKFFDNNGSSEWASGVVYESLINVTYLGNVYTSKKVVPSNIGSPNENPEYWANVTNYNQQINEINSNLSRHSLKQLNNLTIATIGDSFGDTVLSSQGGFGSWVTEMCKMVKFKNVYNYCKNSSGFFSTEEIPYLSLAKKLANEHDPESIDLIVVQGGLNDVASKRTDGTTGVSNIDDTFDYIKNTFTKADVLIVPMTWSATFNGREPFVVGFRMWYTNIINSAIARGFRIANQPYLWNIGHPEFVGSDNFHPNVNGAKNIAGHILASILGNDTWSYNHYEGNISAGSYITWDCKNGTFNMRGTLKAMVTNNSVRQPIPESLVPPKNGSMDLLFNAFVVDNADVKPILAGYRLGQQPDGRGELIFYGTYISSKNNNEVTIYFSDSFTV